jgi:hypothetical protein
MSSSAIAVSPIEDLVASYRSNKLSRTQLLAALAAAGATVAGAAVLVNSIDASSTTPTAQPIAAQGAHQHLTGIASTNVVALHTRHIQLQGGR